MSNTAIQLKKSGESGNTPVDLHPGEVAINYADGKLYYKNDLNQIVYITNQDTFGTISSNGELVLAISPTDVLTINPGHGQSIIANSTNRSLTFGVDETQITSFVKKSGDTMTGDLNISTANIDANYLIVETTLYSGLATRSATPLPNLIAQFTGNTHTYVQVNAQNIDEHGTADYVITGDVGNDTEFYVDIGIINSQYNNTTPNNSLGTAAHPLDGYLYVQGSSINQVGGNLVMGVTHTGQDIKFIAGGHDAENVITKISETDVHVYKDLIVDGSISGPTITDIENYTQAAFDKANIGGGNTYSTISTEGSSSLVANTSNTNLTFVAQTGIAIGLDPNNYTISIATNTFGASNLAVDFGVVTDTLGSITFDYGFVS